MTAKGEGKAYRWMVAHANHPDKDGCLTWPFARERHGRGLMGYNGEKYWAHRFICTLVHGEPPSPAHQAGHDCGKGHEGCVNPHRIKWKTVSENAMDRWQHNPHLHLISRSNGTGRMLTPNQARAIREAKGICTQMELSVQFGVSENVVQNIWSGHRYRADCKVSYWTPEETQKLRDGVAAGLNFTKIAEIVGKNSHTVSTKAYRIGLRSGQPCERKSSIK